MNNNFKTFYGNFKSIVEKWPRINNVQYSIKNKGICIYRFYRGKYTIFFEI